MREPRADALEPPCTFTASHVSPTGSQSSRGRGRQVAVATVTRLPETGLLSSRRSCPRALPQKSRSCRVPGRGGFQRRSRCSVSPLKGTWHFRGTRLVLRLRVHRHLGRRLGPEALLRALPSSLPACPTRCDIPLLKTHGGVSALRGPGWEAPGTVSAGSGERSPQALG